MKKLFPFLAAAVIVAGNFSIQAAPTVDEIIARHLKAIGGVETYKKIKTRRIEAVFDLPALGAPADMTILSKAPDKMHTTMDIPNMGTITEGYDGSVAWTKNPLSGITEKTGGQLKQTQRQADFYRDVEFQSRYATLEYSGTESVNGKPAYVLKGTYEDGSVESLYIDSESYLMVQVAAAVELPTGKANTTIRLGDYREVDGIQIPFSIQMIEPPEAAFTMTIKAVKHNVPVDDQIFKKPEN